MSQTREDPIWGSEIEYFQKSAPKSLYLLYFLGSLDEVPFSEQVISFYSQSLHRLKNWIIVKEDNVSLRPEAKAYLSFHFDAHKSNPYFQEICANAIAAMIPVIISSLSTFKQNDNLFHHAKRLLSAYDSYVEKAEPLILRALSAADFETLRSVLTQYCKLYPDIEAEVASPSIFVSLDSNPSVNASDQVPHVPNTEISQTNVTYITSTNNVSSHDQYHTDRSSEDANPQRQIVPLRRNRSPYLSLGSLGFFGASVLSIYALVNRNNPNFFFNHFFTAIKDNAVRVVTGIKK